MFSSRRVGFVFIAPACPSRSSRSHPNKLDLLKWANSRPGCRLALARYSYKPLRDSPNNYPELELSLEPGDYLLLFGNLDDDYFYQGELFNGEQGLVPSNYVEIIEDGKFVIRQLLHYYIQYIQQIDTNDN